MSYPRVPDLSTRKAPPPIPKKAARPRSIAQDAELMDAIKKGLFKAPDEVLKDLEDKLKGLTGTARGAGAGAPTLRDLLVEATQVETLPEAVADAILAIAKENPDPAAAFLECRLKIGDVAVKVLAMDDPEQIANLMEEVAIAGFAFISILNVWMNSGDLNFQLA